MECCMDIDMFVDKYPHWEVEGLHHPLILWEMFLQAAHSGKREAEWMNCQGCWHSLPCLDPQADVSAIQSVGPQTSREEIQDLYYQVYKLRRLPRSPLCGAEWEGKLGRDIVSSSKKPPEAERGWATRASSGHTPSMKQNPTGREGRHFYQNPACQSERSPPKGPGNHHHFGRKDRVAEPVPY